MMMFGGKTLGREARVETKGGILLEKCQLNIINTVNYFSYARYNLF